MKKNLILFILLIVSSVMAETDIEIRHKPNLKEIEKHQNTSILNKDTTLKDDNNILKNNDILKQDKTLIEILKAPSPSLEKIQLCIENKCNVNEEDAFKRTPLMFAVALNKPEIVQHLLKNGANVNAQDRYKNSPIIIALSSENPSFEIVRMLIDTEADLFEPDIENKSAFDYALLNPTLSNKIMRLVKIQPKVRFLSLIEKAPPYQIQQALRHGAKANDSGMFGVTPLMMAASKNPNALVIDLLLGSGASLNMQDPFGQTALFYAVKNNRNPEVIKVLIQRGSFVHIKDKNGKTVWDYAKQRKDLSFEIQQALQGNEILF